MRGMFQSGTDRGPLCFCGGGLEPVRMFGWALQVLTERNESKISHWSDCPVTQSLKDYVNELASICAGLNE